MSSQDWQQAKELFHVIADAPRADRARLLDEACTGRPALRMSLERLLSASDGATRFLELTPMAPPLPADGAGPAERSGTSRGPGPGVGDLIDRYRLVEVVGEGGFGTVYRAQQEAPLRREVALKLLKSGMDSRQVVARFEAERQALALMDHPNIARVLDGGATPAGLPYFVMEFVRGAPITEYCARHGLSIRARLDLFVDICDAIQHAHQKGIIHRDLKPGNILVGDELPRDETARRAAAPGTPTAAHPKVIDFGVAKAIQTPLTDRTAVTEFRQFLGTPAYMSPEQADLASDAVDTRTDVYSLGVLLYELLTGVTPFDSRELVAGGLSTMQRTLREVEPVRPSDRLRNGDAARSQAVPEELDWIVMKCLEKEPARRYGSVSELARDVTHHLADLPIAAGPPTAAYRFRKFARRHRSALLAGGVALAALVVGLAVAIWGVVAATDARRHAENAATRAGAVSRFLQDMLANADPQRSSRSDMTVREVLDAAVKKLDEDPEGLAPATEAAVRLTIAKAYRELARYPAAEPQAETAVRLARAAYGEQSSEYADALQERGSLRKLLARPAEAETDFHNALAIAKATRKPDDPAIAAILNDLGCALMDQNRMDDAAAALAEADRIAASPANVDESVRAEIANNTAYLYVARQDWTEAERLFRQALEWNRAHLGGKNPTVATNLDNLAQVLVAKGDLPAGEADYQEAIAIRREVLGPDHPDLAMSLHNYATVVYRQGDLPRAEALLRESLAIFRKVYGLTNSSTLVILNSLASVLGGAGKLAEAGELLESAFTACKDSNAVTLKEKQGLAQRLIQLYGVTKQPERQAHWQMMLDALSQPATDNAKS